MRLVTINFHTFGVHGKGRAEKNGLEQKGEGISAV